MKIIDTKFEALKIIENFHAQDDRGRFVKLFNDKEFEQSGLKMDFKESYYSISRKNVIRGMHFQIPPYEHAKLVHVIKGAVMDVVVDLRKKSKNYGKCYHIVLSDKESKALYIPSGFAHGFQCLEDETIMLYNVTSGYQKECDKGIQWDSIPYQWDVTNPIVSERDRNFPLLEDFESPF